MARNQARVGSGGLTFTGWRAFKASVQESLLGVETPPDYELREHMLNNLPPVIREAVIKQEVESSQKSCWVSIHLQPAAERAAALETIGEALGLRIRDPQPKGESVLLDCLTETVVAKALSLDGESLTNPDGRSGGKITIHRVRSKPMDTKDIFALVDSLMWRQVEVQRFAPTEPKKEERKEPQEHTRGWEKPQEHTRGWEKRPSQMRAVEHTSPPKQRSPSETRQGGWTKVGVRATSPAVCFPCQKDGRPAEHPFRECKYWQQNQQHWVNKDRVSTPPSSPKKFDPMLCLTCANAGRTGAHFYRECPFGQKAFEAKYKYPPYPVAKRSPSPPQQAQSAPVPENKAQPKPKPAPKEKPPKAQQSS